MDITATAKNTTVFATKMLSRNIQLTTEKSKVDMERKINAGKEKWPTNVLRPLDSVGDIRFKRPATYPLKIITKHSMMAGYKLSKDISGVPEEFVALDISALNKFSSCKIGLLLIQGRVRIS